MNASSLSADLILASRRTLIRSASAATLSAVAVGLLTGCSTGSAQTMQTADASSDVAILNTALGLEFQAIAAYQAGAESGLLQKPVLDLAVQFQSDHKQHAQVLSSTISKLGGMPVMAKDASAYNFPVDTLKSQADVLQFAAYYEKGATSAYLGAVPALGDKDLAKAAASILGDEAMHWAVLLGALGQNPVPGAFIA